MCRHADTANAPSVLVVSILFGGGSGALVAASAGLDGSGGFLVGASVAFLFLWASVLRPREVVELQQERQPREVDGAVKRSAAG